MTIEHIAMWTKDLEKIREFYMKYFGAKSNDIYINSKKGFKSYFLEFESGCRLEIMSKIDITEESNDKLIGFTHLAFSTGSKEKVDELTEIIRNDGYIVTGEPRTTGDGYYESVILDPEKNKIEITE